MALKRKSAVVMMTILFSRMVGGADVQSKHVEIEFSLERAEVVVGEGCFATVRCKNGTDSPVTVGWAQPWYTGLRVNALRGDGKELKRRKNITECEMRLDDLELAPGEACEVRINIEALVEFGSEKAAKLRLGLMIHKGEDRRQAVLMWSEFQTLAVRNSDLQRLQKLPPGQMSTTIPSAKGAL